jgi:hypothetical protein
MIRTGVRLWSLFLLAVFVGGGFGLADADAVLFHSLNRGDRPEAPHFELPGGCGAHSESCVLATATAPPKLVAGSAPTAPIVSEGGLSKAFASVPSLRSAHPRLLYSSRAPPAPAC